MNRVLAARSLKFSEHRSNEPAQMTKESGRNDVFIHKKSENSKSKGGEGGKLRAAYSTNPQDKLRTPSIVANLIQKESKKKKKIPHGVWSPLGEVYSTHGVPDLELGEIAKIDNKKVKKKRVKEAREERQRLENLMELFRTTKSSLLAVNLFNRPGDADGSLLPSVGEGNGSRESTPRNKDDPSAYHRARSADAITTTQKIAMLGCDGNSGMRKQRAKKKPIDKSLEHVNHLTEDRKHHLSRWRGGFEETKSAMDRALIQKLVKRAEDRDMVYENATLMNNALHLACENPEHTSNPNAKVDHYTIWERARIMGMDKRNAELQKQALQIKEKSRGRPVAKHGRRSRPTSSGRNTSPRLMMRSISQPEFTGNGRTLSGSASTPALLSAH